MNKHGKLVALIAAGALTVGGAAFAQGETGGAMTGGGDTGGAVTGGAEQMEGTEAASVDSLRAALENIQTEISDLTSMTAATNVQIVSVEEVLAGAPAARAQEFGATGGAETGGAETGGAATGGAMAGGMDQAEVDSLISENQAAIEELHQSLQANADILQALEDQGVSVDDVVAVDVTDTGTVVVYFQEIGLRMQDTTGGAATGGGDTGGATGGATGGTTGGAQ